MLPLLPSDVNDVNGMFQQLWQQFSSVQLLITCEREKEEEENDTERELQFCIFKDYCDISWEYN